MIVVFVIDTSPSMGQPLVPGHGMSRLDLAKMAVEDLVRGLNKRINEHNMPLQQQLQALAKQGKAGAASRNMIVGAGGVGFLQDQLLLLSTGRQHKQSATAACGAGGRLLVGYGDSISENSNVEAVNVGSGNADSSGSSTSAQQSHANNVASFQRELKRLQATIWEAPSTNSNSKSNPFPEDGGGAIGLNAALSAGLQLLSRYRLSHRYTENFGMGRYPSSAVVTPNGGLSTNALQPACLILITDGACLRKPPFEGGGSLQLQYGNMPLREFYQEPFRWDQRIFCLGVGATRDGISSAQYLHPHLRALCEVTGGGHTMLRSTASLPQITDRLLKWIAPPLPRESPLPDPLFRSLQPQQPKSPSTTTGTFVNGGPVVCFQALEASTDITEGSNQPAKYRAALLLVTASQLHQEGGNVSQQQQVFQPPLWCIPEAFFASKKLDTLPPRPAQPILYFVKFPTNLGSKSFEPSNMIKMLYKLDQLVLANRKALLSSSMSSDGQGSATGGGTTADNNQQQQIKLLHRDVYICEWIAVDDKKPKLPQSPYGSEYFAVLVVDAGRPFGVEGEENFFNIGILHVPPGSAVLASSSSSAPVNPRLLSTITFLPPEPQILLPLLIRAAENEHRAIKKAEAVANKNAAAASAASAAGATPAIPAVGDKVLLDEHWRSEFRSYLLRLPPYYHYAIKRSLRSVLPSSVHSLLNSESLVDSLPLQCFSKTCFQKIRAGEQLARETNERLERQESDLRGVQSVDVRSQFLTTKDGLDRKIGYGQYDPRSSTESFLAALRDMPAPWLVGVSSPSSPTARGGVVPATNRKQQQNDKLYPDGASSDVFSTVSEEIARKPTSIVDTLGDLPANCLMAYYESRRRWIFGGSGLTTRGIHVEGVNNDGSNVQRCGAKYDILDEPLLSLGGVGVSSLNQTTTTKMGDYRERLLWSRAPVIGYGVNSAGVAATTAADGSPKWSADDDSMPITFFDPRTGEFADSVQARVRSRLMVNFGNPYKEKRADSLVPEKFLSQCPSHSQQGVDGMTGANSPRTPPGSPPHDSFSAVEEDEAVFTAPSPRKPQPPAPIRPPNRDGSGGSDKSEDTSAGNSPSPPAAKRARTDDKNIAESSAEVEKSSSAYVVPPPPPSGPAKSIGTSTGVNSSGVGGTGRPAPPPRPPPAPPKKPPPPSLKRPPPPFTDKRPMTPPSKPQLPPPAKPPPYQEDKVADTKHIPMHLPSLGTSAQESLPLKHTDTTAVATTSSDAAAAATAAMPPPPPPPSKLHNETPTKQQQLQQQQHGNLPPPPPPSQKQPSSTAPSAKNMAPPPPPPTLSLKSGIGLPPQPPSATSAQISKNASGPPPPPPSQQPTQITSTPYKPGPGPPLPPQQKLQLQSDTKATAPRPNPATSAPTAAAPMTATTELDMQRPDKKPNVVLPTGWICVWSKSQKRWYFFDTRSNRSVWQWPPPAR